MANPIDNDPFEEFEFKPITDGLGFHSQSKSSSKNEGKAEPKTESKLDAKPDLSFEARRAQSEKSARASGSDKSFVDDLLDLNSLETGKLDQPLLRTPLLKRSTPPATELPQAPTPKVDELLKGLQKQNWDFKDEGAAIAARKSLKNPPAAVFRPSGYDLSAIVLDAMLVVAAFLGCLIALLMVTEIDLVAVISTGSALMLAATLGSLFATVSWVYLSVNRVFLGATPGEWVFDQRLGPEEVQGTARFAWKAILRSTLILVTGLVLVPIASLIARRDLMGRWTGMELHQKTLQ